MAQVVGGEPVILVGNSLGGYNSLAVAANYPQLVKGVVLLNGAGRFEDAKVAIEQATEVALGEDREGTKQVLRQVIRMLVSHPHVSSSHHPLLGDRQLHRGVEEQLLGEGQQPSGVEEYPHGAQVSASCLRKCSFATWHLL